MICWVSRNSMRGPKIPSGGPAIRLATSGVMTDQNRAKSSHTPSAASAAVAGARKITENSSATASQTPP